MQRYFRIDCWKMDGSRREKIVAYLNPSYVVNIEVEQGISKITTSSSVYYTTIDVEYILRGLNDVSIINKSILMTN